MRFCDKSRGKYSFCKRASLMDNVFFLTRGLSALWKVSWKMGIVSFTAWIVSFGNGNVDRQFLGSRVPRCFNYGFQVNLLEGSKVSSKHIPKNVSEDSEVPSKVSKSNDLEVARKRFVGAGSKQRGTDLGETTEGSKERF